MAPLMTISAPGIYPITSDMTQMSPTDDCIVIAPGVHYVTLLLYSRLVGGGGAGSSNAAVSFNGNACVNIIGMGGSIRGFQYGVRGSNANLAKVRNVAVQDAYFRGISISGENSLIEDNDIRDITGCTFFPNAYCMGIEAQGVLTPDSNISILRNTVRNVDGMGTGESVGISLSGKGLGALIKDNAVLNPELREGSFGYWIGGESDPAFVHNHADTFGYGACFSSPPTGYVDENSYRNCTINIQDSGLDIVRGPGDIPD
jgi:hypothetical protein